MVDYPYANWDFPSSSSVVFGPKLTTSFRLEHKVLEIWGDLGLR